MRPSPIFTTLLLIAASLLWLLRKDLVGERAEPPPARPKNVEMAEVRVRSFQGTRVMDLRGRKIISNELDTEMDLEPVEGSIVEEGRVSTRFHAGKGRREQTKSGERLEFRGKVAASSEEGLQLKSEKLLYYTRTGKMESPTRATLITSDSQITGDRFESSLQLRTGVVTGNVVIITMRFPGREPGKLPTEAIHTTPPRIPYLGAPAWTAPRKPKAKKSSSKGSTPKAVAPKKPAAKPAQKKAPGS